VTKFGAITAPIGLMLLLSISSAFALDFASIRANKDKGMTSLAWDEYTESLVGQPISWTGWVDDVTEKTFGTGYMILIDMDPPDSLSVFDVSIDVPRSLAAKFEKDQKVNFSGRIESVRTMLGSLDISIADATVE
jgi:hypothetical protein